ncbi:MAG TPA: hypothetical protein PKA41_03075 [Verrucomicrobiota bacterium]|nr:hypothetical protein [Verrucomicrobiota bacterium]
MAAGYGKLDREGRMKNERCGPGSKPLALLMLSIKTGSDAVKETMVMQSTVKSSNRQTAPIKRAVSVGCGKRRTRRIRLEFSKPTLSRSLVLRFPHAPVFFPVKIRVIGPQGKDSHELRD